MNRRRSLAAILFLTLLVLIPAQVMADDLVINSFSAYAGQTNIELQATGNIIFSGGDLYLPELPAGINGHLSAQAGSNIVVQSGTVLHSGANWTISLSAGQQIILGSGPISSSSGGGTIMITDGATLGGGTITTGPGGPIAVASPPRLCTLATLVTNLTAQAGTSALFLTTNTFDADFGSVSYQWFKNSTSLPDQTNSFLYLPALDRRAAGTYLVSITTDAGTFTRTAQLHVLVPQLLTSILDSAPHQVHVSFIDGDGSVLSAQDIPSFLVQSSSNLVDWATIAVPLATNTTGGLSFSAPQTPVNVGTFYRVISQ